jgi:hypothetical protein
MSRRGDEIATTHVSDNPERPSTDRGLSIMLKWVFGALILAVLFGMLVVELTLRWFR